MSAAVVAESPEIEEILATLNERQREAAVRADKNLMVIAGAGTGKTHTLTSRIALSLLREEVDPESVLAVTFTNKAAKEMLHRIMGRVKSIPAERVKGMWIGTFHGLCYRMLLDHHELVGFGRYFQVIDDQDQHQFIREIMKARGFDPKENNPRAIQDYINAQKELMIRPEDADGNPFMARFYALYEQERIDNEMMDFGELMLRSYELLRDNAQLREFYRSKFRHVLIDEFQDTNYLQYEWMRLICGPESRVFTVGDDCQSIYSFRGAKVDNMWRYVEDYDAHIVKLEQNYRSVKPILDAANEVIKNNPDQFEKALWTQKASGEKIRQMQFGNGYAEAEQVVREIERLRRSGAVKSYGEIAVLYRTNMQFMPFEKYLTAMRIPYHVTGAVRFTQREEIKHLIAYLRLIIDPNSNHAFLRVINVPKRGIGDKLILDVKDRALDDRVSYFAAADRLARENPGSRKHQLLSGFVGRVLQMRKEAEGMKLDEILRWLPERSGLQRAYEEEHAALIAKDNKEQAEKVEFKIDNMVRRFPEFATAYLAGGGKNDLAEFMNSLCLDDDLVNSGGRRREENAHKLQLMTCHSSKGLEYPVVMLVGAERGIFPSVQNDNEEEERRLFYVAITRAKALLYISFALERTIYGQRSPAGPSPFLSEIPADLITRY